MIKKPIEESETICTDCNCKKEIITFQELPTQEVKDVFKNIYGSKGKYYHCKQCGNISGKSEWITF